VLVARPACDDFVIRSALHAGSATDSVRSSGLTSAARTWLLDAVRPVATRRSLAIVLSGAVAGAACTGFEDAEAYATGLDRSPWNELGGIGNAYGEAPGVAGVALLLYAAGRWGHRDALRDAGFHSMRALCVSAATVGVLKLTVERERPNGEPHSFPSGHAAVTTALAPVLTRHLGWRVGVPAYSLAALSCFGRIEDRRHHLSDVVWGATIGLTVGLAESATPGRGGDAASASFSPYVSARRIGCSLRF